MIWFMSVMNYRRCALDRILITGASGFVGRYLLPRCAAEGLELTVAGRSTPGPIIGKIAKTVEVGEIGSRTEWGAALEGCSTVLHMAGQVPGYGVPDARFNSVNNEGTARLVQQAARSGVKTFILLSSVFAVVDNATENPVDEHSVHRATTPYGLSKLAAEAHVARFAQAGRIGISLRSPLIYGSEAKGNWQQLQKLAATRLPLPFGMIHNRRSLVAIENLVDALVRVVACDKNSDLSGVYAVADDEVISTADIVRWLREGMGLPARLLPIPPAALNLMLKLAGQGRMAQSLLGNLEVNASTFRDLFQWTPPLAAQQAIRIAGTQFSSSRK